jgi:DDE domain
VTKPIARDPIYRRRGFDAEIIELCVRWYISYRLSCRDLVELMADRGIAVSHTTIMRWVIRYVPEFEKRWNRFARPVGRSWRVDETYISVRGRWHYLYRAVDKQARPSISSCDPTAASPRHRLFSASHSLRTRAALAKLPSTAMCRFSFGRGRPPRRSMRNIWAVVMV